MSAIVVGPVCEVVRRECVVIRPGPSVQDFLLGTGILEKMRETEPEHEPVGP